MGVDKFSKIFYFESCAIHVVSSNLLNPFHIISIRDIKQKMLKTYKVSPVTGFNTHL